MQTANHVKEDVPSRAGLRVLVIDDHAIVLQAMRNLLEIDGHLVSTGESGAAGIALFELALGARTPFDLVITDFGMPGMDGREVARRVKQARPATRVVMFSGGGPEVDAGDGWKACVDGYLGKPARLADLRKMLSGLTQ
jgi:CheY-like chemotaxis protein